MPTLADAEALDRTDPFSEFRDRFALPEDMIYLKWQFARLLPRSVSARLEKVAAHDWASG